MRNINMAVMALALAAMTVFLPFKASTAWAFPGSSVPSATALDLTTSTSGLKTFVACPPGSPQCGRAGHQNRGYRNNRYQNRGYRGYRNNRYQNRGYRGYRNNRYQNHASRNNVYRDNRHKNHGYRNHGYRNWRYNRNHHGHRYTHRRRGYNYFYSGFWYANPWWNYGYAGNYGYYNSYDYDYAGGGDDHVNWCLNRYRSYNPQTDTFTGYDGYQHRCNSPY